MYHVVGWAGWVGSDCGGDLHWDGWGWDENIPWSWVGGVGGMIRFAHIL